MKFNLNPSRFYSIIWFVATIAVSYWLAFFEFPAFYNDHTGLHLPLYFLTEIPVPNQSVTETVYWPNRQNYRKMYLKYIDEKETFYLNTCLMLPIQDRAKCDSSKNWWGLPTEEVGCRDVASCEINSVNIPDNLKRWATSEVDLKNNEAAITPEEPLSLNNPFGWGSIARLPLFLFFVFLGSKLGITIRELLFQRVDK